MNWSDFFGKVSKKVRGVLGTPPPEESATPSGQTLSADFAVLRHTLLFIARQKEVGSEEFYRFYLAFEQLSGGTIDPLKIYGLKNELRLTPQQVENFRKTLHYPLEAQELTAFRDWTGRYRQHYTRAAAEEKAHSEMQAHIQDIPKMIQWEAVSDDGLNSETVFHLMCAYEKRYTKILRPDLIVDRSGAPILTMEMIQQYSRDQGEKQADVQGEALLKGILARYQSRSEEAQAELHQRYHRARQSSAAVVAGRR